MLAIEVNARPPAAGPPSSARDRSEGLLEHLLGRAAGVDHPHALGRRRGDLLVGRGHPLEEALVFALEPVGVVAAPLLARSPDAAGPPAAAA